MNFIKKSFKNKLILLIAIFQFILIASLGGYFSNDIINREEKRVTTENINSAKETINDISNTIDLFSKDIELLASIPTLESFNSEATDALLKSTTVTSLFLSNETVIAYNNNLTIFADNTMFGIPKTNKLSDSLMINYTTPLEPYVSTIFKENSDYFMNLSVYIQNRAIGYGYLVAKFSTKRFSDILSSSSNHFYLLFDKNGNIISRNIDKFKGQLISDYDLSSKIYSSEFSGTLIVDNTNYYYATKYNKKYGLGIISLIPDEIIQQTTTKFRILSFFGLIGTFIITFFLSLILSSKLVTPLRELTTKINLVKDGRLDISTKLDKEDEIGDLANSFDKMRLTLQESFNKLKLFISDLKLINLSTDTILTSRSIDDLSKSYLTQIATVFNSDFVSITLFDTGQNFEWSTNDYYSKIFINNDSPSTTSEIINNEFSSGIITPIILKHNNIGKIIIIKNKPNYYLPERLETAEILSSQFNVGLEALRLYREEQTKLLIEHDLQTAKIIQNAIFPAEHFSNEYYSIDYYYESADELSGDWLHYYNIENSNVLQFVIGDVTGHGVGASLLTSTTHTFFSLQSRGLMPHLTENTDLIISELNKLVTQSRDHLNMTLLFAKLMFDTKKIEICNAGHNHAILFRKESEEIITMTLSNLNTRIGEETSTNYLSTIYDFITGDKILFYTDGIIEWKNSNDREWGKKNLVKTVIKHFSHENKYIIKEILNELNSKMINRHKMDDDLTISIITIK